MFSPLRLSALAALTIALASSCAGAVDVSEVSYRITTFNCAGREDGFATAVAFAPDLLASAGHPLSEISSLAVTGPDGAEVAATLVYLDADKDFSIVRLSQPTEGFLPLGDPEEDTEVRIGVFADGLPAPATGRIAETLSITLDGVGRRDGMLLEADIERGDSGAGVIADGRVVGIVFATATKDPNKGWAVSSTEVAAAAATLDADSLVESVCPSSP